MPIDLARHFSVVIPAQRAKRAQSRDPVITDRAILEDRPSRFAGLFGCWSVRLPSTRQNSAPWSVTELDPATSDTVLALLATPVEYWIPALRSLRSLGRDDDRKIASRIERDTL
jgi:hypothetical protein